MDLGRRPSSLATLLPRTLMLLALVAGGVVIDANPASALGTPLLSEAFTQSEVASTELVVGGNFTPCLTAYGAATTTPSPCYDAFDEPGSGALRLTDTSWGRSGFVLYDHPLPTKAGLDIEFTMYQYGGDGADGLSFFLTDGAHTLTEPGPPGGSLGYGNQGGWPGLDHALLGVGFDAYGNFATETNNYDCGIQGWGVPDVVAVRGPGGEDRLSGYCLLDYPVYIEEGIDAPWAWQRNDAARTVRVVVDPPSDESPEVHVYINGTLRVSVPEPAVLASTPTFKFGWAAGTGSATNNHEISNVVVSSIDPIQAELSLEAPPSVAVDVGATADVPMTAVVEADGGPEAAPVTLDITLPSDLAFAGTPAGTGWDCGAPLGSTSSCTYTSGEAILPGTSLPEVVVSVTSSATGTFSVTGAVSSSDAADSGGFPTSETVVTFRPTVGAVTGTAVAHPSEPVPVELQPPTPEGTAPFAFALSSTPDAADGDATMDGSTGTITFTPAAGASGRSTFSYEVTDANGATSLPAAVTVDVAPVAPAGVATTSYETPVIFSVADAPVGTGPFSYVIWGIPAASAGTASIDGSTGEITFTPAVGYSGAAGFSYRALDADGISSTSAGVTVSVQPTTTGLTASVALNSAGTGSGSTGAPSPAGIGPFSYAISAQSASGSASISDATGVVTYTADTGTSGTFTAQYVVTDSDGVSSSAQSATIAVHPYTSPVVGGTSTGTPVTLSAPTSIGTGPFTYTVDPPTGMTATIGADGAISFDPAGHSGTVSFTYEALDAGGLGSGSTTVSIEVRPVVADVSGTAIADSTSPATIELTSPPYGDGPFTYEVVTGLDPALGTVSPTAAGMSFTPAPGVSGVLSATFRVVGKDGVASYVATARLDVSPVAASATVVAPSGRSSTTLVPAPLGTGPFTYSLVTSMAAGTGIASLGATNRLLVTPSNTFSGVTELTYTVTDGDGLTSAPQTIELTVVPASMSGTMGRILATTRPAPSPVAYDPPTPAGTGPFTYTILSGPSPALGAAIIDEETGRLTFTQHPGVSGDVLIRYRVRDVNGLVSDPISVTLEIVPVGVEPGGTPMSATTTGTEPVSLQPPTPVGTAPFAFRLTEPLSPDIGVVTIDPATGRITFVAAEGYEGTVTLHYEVADADGLVSAAIVFTIEVLGVVIAAPTMPMTGFDALLLGAVGAAAVTMGELLRTWARTGHRVPVLDQRTSRGRPRR